jgi:hypothetical protein
MSSENRNSRTVDDFDQTVVIAIRRAKQIVDEAIPYASNMGAADTTMLRKSALEIAICEVLDFIRS